MSLQNDLLTTSFDLLKARQEEFSNCFYQNLFADYPQVKPLFVDTDMKEQAKKLFASLVLVVQNLTNPDALTPALRGLGTRHIKYGVLPEQYPMVGSTLLKSMAATLDENWTDNIAEAWTEAYKAIAEIMLDGTEYSPEILNPGHVPPQS